MLDRDAPATHPQTNVSMAEWFRNFARSCPGIACSEVLHIPTPQRCFDNLAVQFTMNQQVSINQPMVYSGIIYSPKGSNVPNFWVYVHGLPEYVNEFESESDMYKFASIAREYFPFSDNTGIISMWHPFRLNVDADNPPFHLCEIMSEHIARLESLNANLSRAGFHYSVTKKEPVWSFGTFDSNLVQSLHTMCDNAPGFINKTCMPPSKIAQFARVVECLNASCSVKVQPTSIMFCCACVNFTIPRHVFTESEHGLYIGSITTYGRRNASKDAMFSCDVLLHDFPVYSYFCERGAEDFSAILTKHFPRDRGGAFIAIDGELNPFTLNIETPGRLSTLPGEILTHIATLKVVDAKLMRAGFERPRGRHDNWLPGPSRTRKNAFDLMKYKALWDDGRLVVTNSQQLLSLLFKVVCADVFKIVLQFVA